MYVGISITCFFLLWGQLLAGTNPQVAVLLTLASGFGLCSVAAAGGLRYPAGALSFILTAKFLLIGLALKILAFEPSDKTLHSPQETARVMAVGFFALLIATIIQRCLPVPQLHLVPSLSDPTIYLALTIVFVAVGYGGYFVSLASSFGGDLQTGGILGISRVLSEFSPMAIIPALYYAWASGAKRFMSHPVPLSVLVLGITFGLITTSKEGAMTPPTFYLLVSACRYGLWDKRIWSLAGLGVLYYSLVVYPYAQYVRHSGGREGNMSQRLAAMQEAMALTLTDAQFRDSIEEKLNETEGSYFESKELHPFSRMAMIGEADRLIASTHNNFTGWETIIWSLKAVTPSFILPDKPIFGPSNYLAHVADDVSPADTTTQVGYGCMAGLYNAFSYLGVLIGCTTVYTLFYYSFRLWFGDPKLTATPTGTTLWCILLVAVFQHSFVEGQIDTMLFGIIASPPVPLTILYGAAKAVSMVLPSGASSLPFGRQIKATA
jgi:hypothetical protein